MQKRKGLCILLSLIFSSSVWANPVESGGFTQTLDPFGLENKWIGFRSHTLLENSSLQVGDELISQGFSFSFKPFMGWTGFFSGVFPLSQDLPETPGTYIRLKEPGLNRLQLGAMREFTQFEFAGRKIQFSGFVRGFIPTARKEVTGRPNPSGFTSQVSLGERSGDWQWSINVGPRADLVKDTSWTMNGAVGVSKKIFSKFSTGIEVSRSGFDPSQGTLFVKTDPIASSLIGDFVLTTGWSRKFTSELRQTIFAGIELSWGRQSTSMEPVYDRLRFSQAAPIKFSDLVEEVEVPSNYPFQADHRIYFDYGKSSVANEDIEILKMSLPKGEHSKMKFILRGFADGKGDPLSNISISRKRANATKEILMGLGISESQVEIVAHGSFQPLADNLDTLERAKNRRVEIKFVQE